MRLCVWLLISLLCASVNAAQTLESPQDLVGEITRVSNDAEVKVHPPTRIADRNPISEIRWQLTIPQGEKTLTYRYRKFVKTAD